MQNPSTPLLPISSFCISLNKNITTAVEVACFFLANARFFFIHLIIFFKVNATVPLNLSLL